MMPLGIEVAVSALLVLGGGFGLVGSWGLVRLPDAMTRLHAPTKAATLGVGCVLLASMLASPWLIGRLSWHELLITLFLALTAPVTGLFIAKANLHLTWPRDAIPPPGGPPGNDWATYGDPEAPVPLEEEAIRAE